MYENHHVKFICCLKILFFEYYSCFMTIINNKNVIERKGKMKNKLLISLLIIITSYLTYSLFFNIPEINDNSSKNGSIFLDNTQTRQKPYIIKENSSNVIDNNTKNSDTYAISNNISNAINTEKKTITISNFLNNLKCTNYILKSGETLTQVARKYENTCNLNTSLKLIKSINKINDVDNINSGFTLFIPESIITTGTMHLVTTGDTWYSICQKHYNTYDVNSITKILVYINDLPNNDLPLGESIFLPSI